jgi:hypothetical protein
LSAFQIVAGRLLYTSFDFVPILFACGPFNEKWLSLTDYMLGTRMVWLKADAPTAATVVPTGGGVSGTHSKVKGTLHF